MTPSKILEIQEFGINAGRGNLVAIQPYMVVSDYASESCFYQKMESYFRQAKGKGWLSEKSIVVLPEYVAAWLVVADEKPAVGAAKTVETAMFHLIRNNLGSFIKHFFASPAKDRVKYAIFRTKAETMLRSYVSVFSRLAREFGVTVVAGSLALPEIRLENGEWRIVDPKSGPLYNTTLVFRPDGSAYPETVLKVYPTPQELPFTRAGSEAQLPVFDTPAGRLGVLNCADSWYGNTYAHLKKKGVEFLAVPSFVEKDGDMDLPWRGNNITPAPPEFDRQDFQKITYDDAWVKYALPSRFHLAEVQHAVNVFLRGKFWNLGSDGRSILIHDQKLIRGKDGVGAALQNVWLG